MGDELDVDALISELEGALASKPVSGKPASSLGAAALPPFRPMQPRASTPAVAAVGAPAAALASSSQGESALTVEGLLQSLEAEDLSLLSSSSVAKHPLPASHSAGGGAAAAAPCAAAALSSSGGGGGGGGDAGKCTYLCLGASEAPLGSTRSLASRKACPSMRCTACDFAVQAFRTSVTWERGADYLFFRNVFPDREKLGKCLQASSGAAAYCCQCSWVSVLPSDGLAVVRRPGVGPLATSATGAEASSLALGGRVGGQGWTNWVCAGGHST
jgi:hypothetical protein